LSISWNDLDIFLAGGAAKSSLSVDSTVEPAGGSLSDFR